MTLNGAIMQLTELWNHPTMPVQFKPAIEKVIETVSGLEERTEERTETHECDYDRKETHERDLPVADAREDNPLELPSIIVAEGYDSIEDEDGNMGFGVYVPRDKQIYVAGEVPYEIFVKALFHELAHWVQDVAGNKFNEDEANDFAERVYEAIQNLPYAQPEQKKDRWIPCTPSELPKDMLWVTHDNGLWRYVETVYYDMTEWSEPVSDVVAYMPYEKPEPY